MMLAQWAHANVLMVHRQNTHMLEKLPLFVYEFFVDAFSERRIALCYTSFGMSWSLCWPG